MLFTKRLREGIRRGRTRDTMFNVSAEFYDLIYASFKDYQAEAVQIASLLRRAQSWMQDGP